MGDLGHLGLEESNELGGRAHEEHAPERPAGQFTRRLFLGRSLDTDHVEARYDRGVLSLSIPVAEKAKSRRIEIGVSDAAAIEGSAQAA